MHSFPPHTHLLLSTVAISDPRRPYSAPSHDSVDPQSTPSLSLCLNDAAIDAVPHVLSGEFQFMNPNVKQKKKKLQKENLNLFLYLSSRD